MQETTGLVRLLAAAVLLSVLWVPAPASAAEPLHAVVVTIVAEEDFLGWLTAPAVAAGKVPALELTTRHVRDIGATLAEAPYDLVIAHAHARPAQRLAARGVLGDGRTVFANPIALIGPPDDPAGVAGALDLEQAFARLATRRACWLGNRQPDVAALTAAARAAGVACVIEETSRSGAHAVVAAHGRGAYTAWGLHPYTRLGRDGDRAYVIGDARLLRPLVAWTVSASPRREEAHALVAWLAGAEAQARVAAFRLARDPDNQPFWPTAATAGGAARPGSGTGPRAGAGGLPRQGAEHGAGRSEAEMGQQGERQAVAQ